MTQAIFIATIIFLAPWFFWMITKFFRELNYMGWEREQRTHWRETKNKNNHDPHLSSME